MTRSRDLWATEAEQAVLGSIMLDNEAYEAIEGDLLAGDFFHIAHRTIWEAIVAILTDKGEANLITVAERLSGQGRLADSGGMEYLGELVAAPASASAIGQYASLVRERRLERDLSIAGVMLSDLAHAREPIADRMDQAQALVLRLTEASVPREAMAIADALPDAVARLEERHEAGRRVVGLPTGLVDLDGRLRGLMPGQMVTIAARPGMGKSVVALNIALHCAMNSGPAAYFSLEMDAKELVDRAICAVGRVDHDRYRSGEIAGQEEWSRVSSAIGRLNDAALYIDDATDNDSIERIRAKARRIARKRGPLRLVVIDYIQLLEGKGENRREQVDSISRGVKKLAKELHAPVIAVAQLNRALESRTNRRPMLSDLRESGGIEQDSDVVLFLYRDEMYNADTMDRGTLEIAIAKHRGGPTGLCRAAWLGEYQAVADLARDYVPPQAKTRVPRRPSMMDDVGGERK